MSQTVEIREVNNRRLLRKFVDYPNRLYRDVPQFVPAFYGDDMADWNKDKNPAFEYCEAKAFLAYRGKEIVGRIGAILSNKSNEKWGTKRMRFSQVDFIDDKEVADKLFSTVENWAIEKGCNEVHGPLGFCDMDREGMLVDGFDKRSLFITYYNHPYYNDHLQRLGYEKDVDWIEYKLDTPTEEDDYYKRVHRLAERVLESGKYRKVNPKNRRAYRPYLRQFFELINDAYAELYGVVDLNSEQIKKYGDKFIPLINPDFCALIVDKDDKLVGLGVCAMSMELAMQKCHGHLFPFGWARVLHALKKNDGIDMLLTAVKPDLRNIGLNSVIIDHIMQGCIKNGIKYAETGPQLELNKRILGQWKMFSPVPEKRRRCYIKSLSTGNI